MHHVGCYTWGKEREETDVRVHVPEENIFLIVLRVVLLSSQLRLCPPNADGLVALAASATSHVILLHRKG